MSLANFHFRVVNSVRDQENYGGITDDISHRFKNDERFTKKLRVKWCDKINIYEEA